MSLLTSTIAPEDATGVVAQNYATVKDMVGFVPPLCEFLSINPNSQKATLDYAKMVHPHPTLTGKLISMISLLISNDSNCEYCVDFNESMLINSFNISQDEIKAIKDDASNVTSLDDKEKALLFFVLKSVKDPHSTTQDDITSLKNLKATELEIYDALNHGAHIVATDIILDAFKVK